MYAVFIIGPAGSGKTSLATALAERCLVSKRSVQILNLDPAADSLPYIPTDDIRDDVLLKKIMDKHTLGPNGGLMKCLDQYAHSKSLQNLVTDTSDGFYFVDCPGQIEFYTQSLSFKSIVQSFVNNGWQCCTIYALDASFIQKYDKYISGCLNSLIAMTTVGLPQINVLTKVDLVSTPGDYEKDLGSFLIPDFATTEIADTMETHLKQILSDCSLTEFYPVSVNDVDTLTNLMHLVDAECQYDGEVTVGEYLYE